MPLSAVISNISRCSVHDGPGIRTVVYFKGCGLRCLWCHNPEAVSPEKEILYAPTKCLHCGRCLAVCPDHHKIVGNDMAFLREGCLACGKCAEVCPSGALTLCGKDMTVSEVMAEIKKDLHYYRQNGGVTLSGGECLLRPDFVAALLEECKKLSVHIALETALFVPWKNVEKVLPYLDFIFADLKIPDGAKSEKYTGQGNGLIIENLKKLASAAQKKVTVRIPLIPAVNDSDGDIAGFTAILSDIAPDLAGVEVLRYNNLAESKYLISGKRYNDFGEPQTDAELTAFCDRLRSALSDKCPVFCVI